MYDPEARTSIADIENILIYNSAGQAVRVKDVGKVVEHFTPPTIERKDRERVITVKTVVQGVPMSDVVQKSLAAIDRMDLPQGVSVQLAGQYEDQQESFSDLLMLALLILILVYIVMAASSRAIHTPRL